MASRIRLEDTKQQEETNGVKNPPRGHSTARRNQWRQETRQEDTQQQEENQGFKTPAKKYLQQEIQRKNSKK